MGLPWIRLDSNIGSHDKILSLINDPSAARWQAVASYVFAIGWSGSQGTDGFIPRTALPWVHGTLKTARLLEKHGLWEDSTAGYRIKNYADRQQTAAATEVKSAAQRAGSVKGNCIRHHGPDCGCWKTGAK